MKRLLMLNPVDCGAGDTFESNIYDITRDILVVFNSEEFGSEEFEYSRENLIKYPTGVRWIVINESSSDSFEVKENEKRFIICENDRELARELINRIEGLDTTIVNMAIMFTKDK